MIERQIEAPVVPGDDDGRLPVVGEAELVPQPDPDARGVPYVEPGGLVDIAIRELGGELTAVERLPDTKP